MTKAELIKALENMNDNDEVIILETRTDHDGWLYETYTTIERVDTKAAYTEREEAKRKAINAKVAEDYERTIAKERAEMAADNKPTKAAAKRNAERAARIEWMERKVATLRA